MYAKYWEMILTYKYRLLPTKQQYFVLAAICGSQRQLYNAGLQERIDCYQKTGKTLTCFDQQCSLTEWRRDDIDARAVPANLQRWTLKRLDDAFSGFFRRLKVRNGKAGFPRFRGRGWWNSFGFLEFRGIRWDGRRLRFKGMRGGIRVHLHRPLPKNTDIRSCIFRRDGRGWYICFVVNVKAPEKCSVNTSVGIDLGLKVFAYQSDNIVIPNPRIARHVEKEMRCRQRALARCKRGSTRRRKVKERLSKLHCKIVNTRTTWLHQQSARLANAYDLIVVEDLQVQKMMKNSRLARSIADASWSMFLYMIEYKAERAGVHFIKVNPKNTSQKCSGCGELVPKALAVRTHSCPSCGLTIDRDWNAALNILNAAVLGDRGHNVVHQDKRVTGNLSLVSN